MAATTRPLTSGAGAGIRRRAALFAAGLLALLGLQVGLAGPVAAHAELVDSMPADGQRLAEPPTTVTLRFTESVTVVDGGVQLLDADGDPVPIGAPAAEGSTVQVPLSEDLPAGAYVVSWRVLSGDGHPVSGAFGFGVGTAAPPVEASAAEATAPWPVTVARLGGYLGFSVLAGVVMFASLCWPAGRREPRLQRLLRIGLVLAVVSTVAALLVQGPYAAGAPLRDLLSPTLLGETGHTPFGAWTQLRLVLLLAVAAVLWPAAAMESTLTRWLAAGGVVAMAVTFSGTGHAAASGGLLEPAVDSMHALAAGVWVGGLIAVAVAATLGAVRPPASAIGSFARLALFAVVVIVATGTANAWLRLGAVDQLWTSSYGQLLSVKVALVAGAVAVAALSQRAVRRAADPGSHVRVEAATTVAVLAMTAVLASTEPPSTFGDGSNAANTGSNAGSSAGSQPADATVSMDLGDGRSAQVSVAGVGTDGSRLRVRILGADGRPLRVHNVQLQASLAAADLGPLDVPLVARPTGWVGDVTFPLAGTWTLTLAVHVPRLGGVVTGGELAIV